MNNRVFECLDCGEIWEVEPCTAGGKHGYEIPCPNCGSYKKAKLLSGERHVCGGEQHQHSSGCGCCGHKE